MTQEHKTQEHKGMNREKGYQKLLVWQKADELALKIYQASKNFPKEELYGITSQLRRSALSVPTNIVEGMGRQGKNETKQFMNIALGSLAETEYLLQFCHKLNYMCDTEYENLESLRNQIGAMLWKFYKSF